MPSDPPSPAGPATAPSAVRARYEQARAGLRRALGASEAAPLEEARRLGHVERDVLRLARELEAVDPDVADDPGHPVLADLAAWRRTAARLGLDGEIPGADALVEGLVGDEAGRWRDAAREAAAGDDVDLQFRLLGEATLLDREALARQDGPVQPPPLVGDRGPLREAFARGVAAGVADEARRTAWARDLLDRADEVLTAIDDLAPPVAAADLDVVSDDLAWHLRHVERRRGERRRRLARKLRRLRAERQERRLQGRLEGIFGARAVGRFERLVLALIFLVLGLLAIEALFTLSERTRYWFAILDTLSCFVFLWEFFFKLALVEGRWRWFRRHVLVDLVPSIPVGLLVLHEARADPLRLGRAVRLLRLTRVARYVRGLRPLIRLIRVFGFFSRGLDRVVRHYGHLLNRDVILYPTREERARSRAAQAGWGPRLRLLQAEVRDQWEDLLRAAPDEARAAVARTRVEALEAARAEGLTRRGPSRRPVAAGTREITAENLLERLAAVTPESIEAEQGADFTARTARVVRLLAGRPLRWMPLVRPLVPRIGPTMGDAEVVAAGAHRAAAHLEHHLARWFRLADLYGTVAPAEAVDRAGTTLVKSASRPAYRLALFGGFYLLVVGLLRLSRSGLLQGLSEILQRFVGVPLIVLGGVCFLLLGLGWWLKRLASQATAFYEQTAAAQFLPLMESVKGRTLAADADLVVRRVLLPEERLQAAAARRDAAELEARFEEGVKAWLLEAQAGADGRGAFDAVERAVMLYRDGLDGALLCTSDDRTTSQLLGSPVMRELRRASWRIGRQESRALQSLDLTRPRRLFGGPYMWFSLISTAIQQSAARLIVEYNRHALPRAELPFASDAERASHASWLAGAGPVDERIDAGGPDAYRYVTTAFSALHFLDDDPRRDAAVAERFGPEVLRRLREDRRRLFRRIFGTYPLHARARAHRVVNLYRFYETWLAGGRALLLPFRVLGRALRWVGVLVRFVAHAVGEIRHPRLRDEVGREAESDFSAALRKIDRMRGPVVLACLEMRVRFDAEYVGVQIPGLDVPVGEVGADLAFVQARGRLLRVADRERDRAQDDMRRLARLLDDGLLDRLARRLDVPRDLLGPEHVRALAFAYRADVEGVRTLLSAPDVIRETLDEAGAALVLRRRWFTGRGRRRAFRRWWAARGRGTRAERRAAWRLVQHDVNGVGRALRAWDEAGDDDRRREGETRLARLLHHPSRLSGQLVTLRTIQTLSLVDLQNYRAHVWRLGGYAADGDDDGGLLAVPPPGRELAEGTAP